MRYSAQVARVAYLFSISQTVEAGPLKWAAADVARRADVTSPDSVPSVGAQSTNGYSGPLTIIPVTLPQTTPGVGTTRTSPTEPADTMVSGTGATALSSVDSTVAATTSRSSTLTKEPTPVSLSTSTRMTLSSAPDSKTTTQPVTVANSLTAFTSIAGLTTSPQTTVGNVVSTTTSNSSTASGMDLSSSTTAPGSDPLTTAILTTPTTPGKSQFNTTRSITPPYIATDGTTKPALASKFPFSGNTTRRLLSTANENNAPSGLPTGVLSSTDSAPAFSNGLSTLQLTSALATIVRTTPTATLPGMTSLSSNTSTQSDGLQSAVLPTTATSETARTTLSFPYTNLPVLVPIPQASTTLTPTFLTSMVPTLALLPTTPSPSPSLSSSSSSSSLLSSTGTQPVLSFKPTETPDANVPTAMTSFPTVTTRVAAAIYASNLAQAKDLNKIYSSLTPQRACSGTQMACIEGKIAQCVNGAFVLTNCPNNHICYALPMTNIRGAKLACSDPAEAFKILGPASEDMTSIGGAPFDELPTTSRTERKTALLTLTRVVIVTDLSSSASEHSTIQPEPTILVSTTTELLPVMKLTTTTTSSSSSSSSSSLPPPPPPPPPPPHSAINNQPGRIVIIQTFNKPTQVGQATRPTATASTTSGLLELIPVELSSSSSSPPPARITASIPAAGGLSSSNALNIPGDAGPAGPGSGNSRTTVTGNGTPTVSVYLTVTVTQKEKETETVTATITVIA